VQVVERLDGGGAASASVSVAADGWFVTEPLVVIAGCLFGVAWALVGWARWRGERRRAPEMLEGVADG
jgi:ABC-type uncharacterized transport system permease subunit